MWLETYASRPSSWGPPTTSPFKSSIFDGKTEVQKLLGYDPSELQLAILFYVSFNFC